MNDLIEQFRQAIAAAVLTPPTEIIDDGAIHRFSTSGKPTHKNGWYMLHTDGIPAGAFGDWRAGFTQNWCSKADTSMTEAERFAHRERVKAMQRQREDDLAQRQQLAAADALKRWTAATPCTQHDYLTRKGIQPHGAKIEGDKLLIPMRDTAGTVHSLQTIAPDGTKMFMSGGRVKGCYFGIGKPKGALIVCEGYATGASIHECTGHAVAVAFNAGNLEAVTEQKAVLCNTAGQAFYNTSKFTLRDLKSRGSHQQLLADFEDYLNGFSPNVLDILENFKFRNQLSTLSKADALGTLINKFLDPDIDLTPAGIDNHAMGTVFEELVRKFNEENNEEAGEHWTPRDAVRLMANLVFLPIESQLKSGTYLLFDDACGTGGMLTVAEETLTDIGKKAGLEIDCRLSLPSLMF